jgi:hypothetical protein
MCKEKHLARLLVTTTKNASLTKWGTPKCKIKKKEL